MKFLMFALITTALLSNPAISQESDSMESMESMENMENMGNMKEKGMKETAMEGMACM